MGKGDKKSKRGKIAIGSHGVKRRSKNAEKGLNARLGITTVKSNAKAKPKALREVAKAEKETTKVAKAESTGKKTAAEKKPSSDKKSTDEKKRKPVD